MAEYSKKEAITIIAKMNKKYNKETTKREDKESKIYNLLNKAQDLVIGTDLENAYFDFCQYHIEGLRNTDLTLKDLEVIEKSAKTIIEIAKMQKDIISILY